MSQIAASQEVQADSEGVKYIMELCDELLDKIAESREIERRDYQNFVEEYKANREGQLAKLDEVKGKIANLELEIQTLNKRIASATNERDEQLTRASQKQEQHDEKLKYCEDENIAYAERRETRMEERTIVSQAIGLLQSKLRTFRKYV